MEKVPWNTCPIRKIDQKKHHLPCPDIIYYIYKYIKNTQVRGVFRSLLGPWKRGIISGNIGATDFGMIEIIKNRMPRNAPILF
jgi:hypothetical protein